MTFPILAGWLTLVLMSSPGALVGILGVSSLLGRPLPERVVSALTHVAFSISTSASLALLVGFALSPEVQIVLPLGKWFETEGYHFELVLLVDGLSVTFAALTAVICGIVGAFAHRYLHREPGYNRFFFLLALFAFGMTSTALAGTLELVYAAWEIVGLSSALLIAFHQERIAPLSNGLRTFVVYRVCDMGLLAAVALTHHATGHGDITELEGGLATAVTLLLLLAAAGKSAQVPFSGWLPRAMEGPTPSSAIFYGALSVHAGAYLLLRAGPLLDESPLASFAVVLLGLATAFHATLSGRVQTDVKTALAYASLTQVGIILVEIGLGLRLLPLLHLVGNALTRTLQFLRAPSILHDFHQLQNAVGGHLGRTGLHLERSVPDRWQRRLYVFALERAYLDAILDAVVARLLRMVRALDRIERAFMERLGRSLPSEGAGHDD
jgi:NAD(P)H-quinone oxidoreductase subunit 5